MRRACGGLLATVAVLLTAGTCAATPARLDAGVRHSSLALLPSISPPPRLNRKMVWSQERFAPRSLASAAKTFGDGIAAVGFRDQQDIETALAHVPGLSVVAIDKTLRVAEVSGTPAALARLATSQAASPSPLRYVEPVQTAIYDHQRNDPATFQIDTSTGQPYEWNFAAVGMDRALNVAAGSPDMLVGYVDSGYSDIPDMRGKVAESWYFTSEGNSLDVVGHGTFVGSLIAAANDDGLGMAGFCGACRVIPFRDDIRFTFTFATAVQKLVDEHVRVLNLSLSFPLPSYLVSDALTYAINAGVLPVISSGNDGVGVVSYPASFVQPDNGALGYGLAVGASDINGNRVFFSNFGSRLSLNAPGAGTGSCSSGVYGALPPGAASDWDTGEACGVGLPDASGNKYAYWNGTSFSAPEVAGIAALVWSANPALKNYQVADILERSATRPAGSGWTPDAGWGVVNAAAAVELATGRATADALIVGNVTLQGRLKAGTTATATGTVTWADGATVAAGTAQCAVTGGASPLNATGTVTNGAATCSFPVPLSAAGRTLTVSMTATVGGTAASGTVGGQVPQLAKPKVTVPAKKTKKVTKPKPKPKPKPKKSKKH
jgi:hypothetical protein